MDTQEILYRNYIETIGDGLLQTTESKPAQVGEVRLFFMEPPEWILIADKPDENLYLIVPLTAYIQLAITDRYPPVIRWRNINLVPLPFWVYVRKELLEKYSEPAFKIKDLEKIKEYVRNAKVRGIGKWREKFIKAVAERFKDLNLSSIIYDQIKAEEEKQERKVIPFPQSVYEVLKPYEEVRFAAQTKAYLKGKNWIGAIEENTLILYLPAEIIGKGIRITLKGEEIYRGKAFEEIRIENFPSLKSYEFLERELNVELLQN